MLLFPVFPVRLLMLVLPVAAAAGILAFAGGRGVSVFKKQGVAWCLTALMIVAAVGIGYAKAVVGNPIPDVPQATPPVSDTVPSDLQVGPGAFPSHVQDNAGVLSDRTVRELDQRNLRLYGNYGVVIGVITCNYGRDDLDSYAIKRAEDMGLSGRDFIVALDISGDNYWLIQGADLVYDFTDEDCADYAWDYMEDYFAVGLYDDAVLSLTEALENWYGRYFR